MTLKRIDTSGRTWIMFQRTLTSKAAYWVVYCDTQCMMITHSRLIAERVMPVPRDKQQ